MGTKSYITVLFGILLGALYLILTSPNAQSCVRYVSGGSTTTTTTTTTTTISTTTTTPSTTLAGSTTTSTTTTTTTTASTTTTTTIPGGGRTFFINYQSGNDSTGNGTEGNPWKTFTKANESKRLIAGDTVMFMDTVGTNYYPQIAVNCNSNANNGSVNRPITLQAQHNHLAWVRSVDGTENAIDIENCSYWNLTGLRVSNVDNASGAAWKGNAIWYYRSNNFQLKGLLVWHANKLCEGGFSGGGCNCHTILLEESHDGLVEDSEVYEFHRHGISIFKSRYITVRRTYLHGRPVAGYPGNADGKPTAIIFYGSSDGIIENCIAEYDGGFNVAGSQVYDGTPGGYRNRILASIQIDPAFGNTVRGRAFGGCPGGTCVSGTCSGGSRSGQTCYDKYPTGDNTIENEIVIRPSEDGITCRGAHNTVINHVTILNQYDAPSGFGIGFDQDTSEPFYCTDNPDRCQGYVDQSVVANSQGKGIMVDTNVTNNWWVHNTRSRSNGGGNWPTSETPGDNVGNIQYSDANSIGNLGVSQGKCVLWPQDANGWGATVLYETVNGAITVTPLWNVSTGAFVGCGATVAGINDVAGKSCFDVQNRVNAGKNGCSFPVGYP